MKINIVMKKTTISKIAESKTGISIAAIYNKPDQISDIELTIQEKDYLDKKITNKELVVKIYRYPQVIYLVKVDNDKSGTNQLEAIRKAGASIFSKLKSDKIESIQIQNFSNPELTYAFAEGLLLAGYDFSKYKKEKNEHVLVDLFIVGDSVNENELDELAVLVDAVSLARDLVNEPLSALSAVKFSEEISRLGEEAGFDVEVFRHQKIKSLKMGGLLAVNKGSIDPPTFSILEWKPENCKNEKPVVLVGKGIVYDTGGLSLKPTPNSMDYMKSDMGGAAAIVSTIYALAKLKAPVHVIGLVPATDNRPDGNAYVPGDIITMFDGTTVEIKNTDAEGRLILADALSYAKKYNPLLVIDVATLTGSASMITGKNGIVAMGNDAEKMEQLKITGEEVYERIIELPLWEEFGEALKSPIADMNNLGVREGQASIAGKFLEHFTDYPWIHLDIAGPAFIFEDDGYRLKGATGYTIRLLFRFLKNYKLTKS